MLLGLEAPVGLEARLVGVVGWAWGAWAGGHSRRVDDGNKTHHEPAREDEHDVRQLRSDRRGQRRGVRTSTRWPEAEPPEAEASAGCILTVRYKVHYRVIYRE
jgi:hypothetical protein